MNPIVAWALVIGGLIGIAVLQRAPVIALLLGVPMIASGLSLAIGGKSAGDLRHLLWHSTVVGLLMAIAGIGLGVLSRAAAPIHPAVVRWSVLLLLFVGGFLVVWRYMTSVAKWEYSNSAQASFLGLLIVAGISEELFSQ